ncbi:hypothetical protein JSMCR1_3664 [Escherichia coli]|nr:hypothetical protein JSMCR1_3664 [Escherichia coli]
MKFPLRDVFRLHLRGHLFRRQPALRKPCLTLRTHRSRAQFPLQPPQHHRQLRRERHTRVLLQHLRQAPVPRLRLFAILCFDSDERREAPRLVYRLDTRGAGLYRRQPVTVPPVPCHLRFTRQRHPPRQVTLPPPYPFSRPAAQRVIEVPALHLWFAVLYPRVEHQAVLAVVVVVVGPLVVHPYHPFRDAVRLLRQPAVFIVAVDIVRIFRDAVIRD